MPTNDGTQRVFQKLITLSRQPYLLRVGTKIEQGCYTEFTGYHPPPPVEPSVWDPQPSWVCVPSLPCNCLSPELRGHLVTSQSSLSQSGGSFTQRPKRVVAVPSDPKSQDMSYGFQKPLFSSAGTTGLIPEARFSILLVASWGRLP